MCVYNSVRGWVWAIVGVGVGVHIVGICVWGWVRASVCGGGGNFTPVNRICDASQTLL